MQPSGSEPTPGPIRGPETPGQDRLLLALARVVLLPGPLSRVGGNPPKNHNEERRLVGPLTVWMVVIELALLHPVGCLKCARKCTAHCGRRTVTDPWATAGIT